MCFAIARHIEDIFATKNWETCPLRAGREAGPVGVRCDPELRRALARSASRISSLNAQARAAGKVGKKVVGNADNKIPMYMKLQDMKRYWLSVRSIFGRGVIHVCLQNDATRFGGGRGGHPFRRFAYVHAWLAGWAAPRQRGRGTGKS